MPQIPPPSPPPPHLADPPPPSSVGIAAVCRLRLDPVPAAATTACRRPAARLARTKYGNGTAVPAAAVATAVARTGRRRGDGGGRRRRRSRGGSRRPPAVAGAGRCVAVDSLQVPGPPVRVSRLSRSVSGPLSGRSVSGPLSLWPAQFSSTAGLG